MTRLLLDSVFPSKLAERRQVIDCEVQIKNFARLTEIVQSDLAVLPAEKRPAKWQQIPVAVRLSFDFGTLGKSVPLLKGEVSTTLVGVCQRCLEACSLPLKTTLRYLLIPLGADAIEYEDYEIWELAEQTMRPIELLDEALIMAMPFSVFHRSIEECGPLVQEFSPVAGKMARPFAGLRAQLKDLK